MDVLRTPDDRFAGLPDYDFAPHYREVVAVDGTPSAVPLPGRGAPRRRPRPAAPRQPDLVLPLPAHGPGPRRPRPPGGGPRPDGPRALRQAGRPGRASRMAGHTDWMGQWLEAEDLRDITLFCQDWGGMLGLALLPDHGDRFARVVASNTGSAGGSGRQRVHRTVVGLQPVGRRAAGRGAGAGRHHPCAVLRRGGGVRRAVPRRLLPGGAQAVPRADPDPARQPRRAAGQGHLGVPRDVGEAVPDRVR